jgi:putative hemolysin
MNTSDALDCLRAQTPGVEPGVLLRQGAAASAHTRAPQLRAAWARDADDLRQAQRLRWRVFAGEMGARLQPPPGTPPGIDADVYDAHCERLLVRTVETPEAPSRAVGTYRVLTPAAARRLGRPYTEDEFELSALAPWRPCAGAWPNSAVPAPTRSGAVAASS